MDMEEVPRTRKRSVLAGKLIPTPKAPKLTEKEPSPVPLAREEDAGNKESGGDGKSRQYRPWSESDSNIFYDALKTVGKDFEAVRKHMSAKAGKKSYEQIRNHYYNTLIKISALAPPEMGDAGGKEKEIRELFLLINYGEWRRRGFGPVAKGPSADRFRELLLKGATTLRRGKAPRTIRTPNCPSLRRFAERHQGVATLPPSITIELVPKTHGDKQWVLDCEQNPLVRLQPSPNQPLEPLLRSLQRRWIPPALRVREKGGEDIGAQLPRLRLFPSAGLRLSSILLRTAGKPATTAAAATSWEGLQRRSTALPDTPADEGAAAAPVGEEAELLVSPHQLRNGLGLDNMGALTAGELCLMCGMAPTIRLAYDVRCPLKPPDDEPTEAWTALITLLRREYGEILNRTATQESAATTPLLCSTGHRKGPVIVPGRALPITSIAKESTATISVEETGPPPVDLSACTSVSEENQAFLAQFAQLSSRRIVRRSIVAPPPNVVTAAAAVDAAPSSPKIQPIVPAAQSTPIIAPDPTPEVEAASGLIAMSAEPLVDVEETSDIVGLVAIPDSQTPPPKEPRPTDFSILSPSLSRGGGSTSLRELGLSNDAGFAEMLAQVGQQDSVDFVKHFQRLVDEAHSRHSAAAPPLQPNSDTLNTPNKEPS